MKFSDRRLNLSIPSGSFLLLAARHLVAVLAVLLVVGCDFESSPPAGHEASRPAAETPVETPVARPVQETRSGPAAFINKAFHGKKTASGEIYEQDQLVAAHPSYPLDTIVRVTHLGNGRAVEVRVIDRSAAAKSAKSPIIDVSHAAAVRLGFVQEGTAKVRTEVLEWGGDPLEDR